MSIISYSNGSAPFALRPELTAGLRAYWDPSDLSTLFQNAAGLRVTGPGQPVGRILDKSKPIGVDIANPLPSVGIQEAGTNTGAAWDAAKKTMTVANVGNNAGYPRFEFKYAEKMVVGRTYLIEGRLSGDFRNVTQIRLNTVGNDNGMFIDAATGIINGTTVAGSTSMQILFNGTLGAANVVIESLTIRELSGNDWLQATTAARTVLRRMPRTGRRNLVPSSNFGAGWTGNGSFTRTFNAGIGPTGKMDATLIESNAAHTGVYTSGVITSGVTVTISCCVKSLGSPVARIGVNNQRIDFNPLTGDLSTSGTLLSYSAVPIGEGWFRCSLSFVADNATAIFYCTPGGMLWAEAQIEVGAVRTPPQTVVSVNDVTETNVPDAWSLYHDGNDDFMQMNTGITLPAGYTLIAAHELTVKQAGLFTSINTSCGWWTPSTTISAQTMHSTGSDDWRFQSDPLPTSTKAVAVISSKGKARWNGKEQRLTASAGSMKPLALPLIQLGKRGSANDFMQGNFYGGMIFDRELIDAEIAVFEKILADKSGAVL